MRQRIHGVARVALVALAFCVSLVCTAVAADLRIILLGTGDPQPEMPRFRPSILVQAGSHNFVFDAGRGVAQRLRQADVPFDRITAVFLTHLHSDHVVGLPDLWLTGWLVSNRPTPLEMWGPPGTAAMAKDLESAFTFDVGIRVRDNKSPAAGGHLIAHDLPPGVVFDRDGVRVEAFEVDHGAVKPAHGYRIQYGGHSAVLSGDTRLSENLIAHAQNADVIIHNVAFAPEEQVRTSPGVRAILARLATPAQAAEVFARTKPRVAVYSHIVLLGGATEADVMRETRERYHGSVYMGQDQMRIDVGSDVVVTK